MKTYQKLASAIIARNNCIVSKNEAWEEKHNDAINGIIGDLPHGSGIDGKTTIDIDASSDNKILIESCYHAMNDNGYYDGWIDFKIILRPSLSLGYTMRIVGNFGKYASVKDYLYDTFSYAFDQDYID